MAVVTKGDEGNDRMDREQREEDRDERAEQPGEQRRLPEGGRAAEAAAPAGPGGFFSIYKPGQGYWTRLGTVIVSAGLIIAIGQFVYVQLLRARFQVPVPWAAGSVSAVVLAAGIILWHFLNKPTVVDFLIATESEMKKVNWTSRKELIGSTKVVILFMFAAAVFLFLVDVAFGYFFFLIKVLKTGPFG